MPYLTSAFGAGWRHHLWLALLVCASLGLTLGFACAVPFAAFGAVAALSLPRRDALLLTVGLWLVNQIVGFTVMQYPWDAMTAAWGGILGLVAILSTGAARAVVGRCGPASGSLLGFAAAFVAYEGSLYLISSLGMGGVEDFTPAIVVSILQINAAAFAALLATAFALAAIGPRHGASIRSPVLIASR
ncbi:MAG: hypothetical protein JO038_08985 [Alphaproteobacteria bacterium]|nr:hypothetical protein [Alphaproteobacteria bacterium]